MQRSSALLLWFVLVGLLVAAQSAARAEICLPPAIGDRPRLTELGKTQVLWLELLFRQHEVCWRAPRVPDETRIFAIGNSTTFGFPLPYDQSAIGLVNQHLERRGIPAHVFNLGFAYTYQVKEALILSEVLAYEPDFIVYGVTLDDLIHIAPFRYRPLVEFFNSNSFAVERLAANPPPTFEEPFRRYLDAQADDVRPYAAWLGLRQAGTFIRVRARQTAKTLRKRLFPGVPDEKPEILDTKPDYRCKPAAREFNKTHENWQAWSMLDYLAELRAETGIEVLVVNWPVAHEPQGRCYNVRYPAAAFADYVSWMEDKAESLKLPYLDIHDLLAPVDFVDSVHPTASGQRKVAVELEAKLDELLAASGAR